MAICTKRAAETIASETFRPAQIGDTGGRPRLQGQPAPVSPDLRASLAFT